ncbi:unnamed protein product [Symbiodinium sp. CCMP2592]|nr:unnamed protein product [Symbiodinium sp. CCMP2592]
MWWVQEEFGRHKKQVDAKEKLKISHGHGDPEHLESALREAEGCGIEDEHLLQAQSRLRELRTAERQLHSAIEAGDRVHLTSALEEASRNGLKTSKVDEAQRKLQSSKTGALVSAIRSRDYDSLKRAISEAEARRPEEVREIADVLSQAKDVHRTLDAVAKRVSAALRTLNYEDLQSSVEEASQYHIVTDDVKKAEGVLSTMSGALEKLTTASSTGNLSNLQESLHEVRQLGLQGHPLYQSCEELFSRTCMPSDLEWALDEQRAMWIALCLRRPLGKDGTPLHPFAVCAAELCHNAQISPEAEPYSVQYINYVLLHCFLDTQDLDTTLRTSLEDLTADKRGNPEVPIDAKQFNQIGCLAKQVQLQSTAPLLWWLVCIIEWQTGHRIFLSFMSELLRRTADLLNEAESTSRALKTHITALQAQMRLQDEEVPGAPEVAPEMRSGAAPGAPVPQAVGSVAVITSAAAADARVAAVRAVLEEIGQVKKEAEKLQANLLKTKVASPDTIEADAQGMPDFNRILELLQQAGPRNLEEARLAVQKKQREASGTAREIYGDTYGVLEKRLLQLQLRGRQAVDGEVQNALTEKEGAPSPSVSSSQAVPEIADAQLPLATLSATLESAGSVQDHAFLQLLGVPEPSSQTQTVDRCFQKVEVYDRFSEKTGTVEDEFEKLCRSAVADARERCGGRRLIAALKPLLVDLVKRRQGISSMLNTLRSCGLDKVEKNLLRKHLQPRDILIALTFSSMAPGAHDDSGSKDGSAHPLFPPLPSFLFLAISESLFRSTDVVFFFSGLEVLDLPPLSPFLSNLFNNDQHLIRSAAAPFPRLFGWAVPASADGETWRSL